VCSNPLWKTAVVAYWVNSQAKHPWHEATPPQQQCISHSDIVTANTLINTVLRMSRSRVDLQSKNSAKILPHSTNCMQSKSAADPPETAAMSQNSMAMLLHARHIHTKLHPLMQQ
jgi:hypothetical protein